jgi:hypothetical protein
MDSLITKKTRKIKKIKRKIKKTRKYDTKKFKKAYLSNPICQFRPLFNINYSKKQNIVSSSFFKMDTGGYKSFTIYTDGLLNLSKLVRLLLPSFRIRLFIDNSIYLDKNLMKMINKIDNIDCVLYKCPNFIDIKDNNEYHLGPFGTFMRYMPMFDFQNNDAGDVIIYDIDIPDISSDSPDYLRLNYYNTLKNIYPNLKDTYLAIWGRLFHNNIKNKFIHNGKYIVPYVIASKIINFKKIPNKIFVDFLTELYTTNVKYINYKISKKEEHTKCSKNICFGVDEYFINNVVIYYLINNKMSILITYSYSIFQPFYFATENIKNKSKYNQYINFLLKGVNYSGNGFKFIDNLFYEGKVFPSNKLNSDMIQIGHNFYKLMVMLFKKEEYSIISKDFILLSLSKNLYGSIYVNRYIHYFNKKSYNFDNYKNLIPNIKTLNPRIKQNKLIKQILS